MYTKPLTLIAIGLTCLLSTAAGQTKKSDPKKPNTVKKIDDDRLLPGKAFDRMIIQDITYAVAGENTPVSGVKIDLSKPEGTISGMFPIKESNKTPFVKWFDIIGFELKGGVTDKNFSFLKGFNSANSAYDARLSFHYIPYWNSANYGDCSGEDEVKRSVVLVRNRLVDMKYQRLQDTIVTMNILYNYYFKNVTDSTVNTQLSTEQKDIAAYLIPKILGKPDLTINANNETTGAILSRLGVADTTQEMSVDSVTNEVRTYILIKPNSFYETIVELNKKYQKLKKTFDDDKLDKKIANASEAWTSKKYWWLTWTPFVRTEKVTEFYTKYDDLDNVFKPGYRWYYGLTFNLNRYLLYSNKIAWLFRLSASAFRNNNISTLSSYNYETRSPFFTSGTGVTQKTTGGTAYDTKDIKSGFDRQVGLDVYFLPLATIVPGLYVSSTLNKSNIYNLPNIVGRESHKFKLSAEAGFVFNINNREKDKSILSILPYFRYEDLTDSRRTNMITRVEESKDDFQKRNISIGIRVGIPITLPKRTN